MANWRIEEINKNLTSVQVLEIADKDDSVTNRYAFAFGFFESQLHKTTEYARELAAELEIFKARLSRAEEHVSDDSSYWD